MFAKELEGYQVVFHCDNSTVVTIINAQSSKCDKLMVLIRPMVLIMLKYNLTFTAKHIIGSNNILCEKLSRGSLSPQLLSHYGMERVATPIPAWLRPQNFKI